MPIILEGNLQKLRSEAESAKSRSSTSTFRNITTDFTEEENSAAEQQSVEQEKKADRSVVLNVKEATSSKQTSSSSQADSIKKYRERQQRIKNSK